MKLVLYLFKAALKLNAKHEVEGKQLNPKNEAHQVL
jgi:hypothetical protein